MSSKKQKKDCSAWSTLQINDQYKFPEQLNLDYGYHWFLAEELDQSISNLYKLHSVLVHSGGVHGGHCHAFICPDGKQWLKFEDDKVTTPPEVLRKATLGPLLMQRCL